MHNFSVELCSQSRQTRDVTLIANVLHGDHQLENLSVEIIDRQLFATASALYYAKDTMEVVALLQSAAAKAQAAVDATKVERTQVRATTVTLMEQADPHCSHPPGSVGHDPRPWEHGR